MKVADKELEIVAGGEEESLEACKFCGEPARVVSVETQTIFGTYRTETCPICQKCITKYVYKIERTGERVIMLNSLQTN